MICPRCNNDNTTAVGNSHYVCNIETCIDDQGNRTQFQFVVDNKIKFPHNVIYPDKPSQSFYRKPYLNLTNNEN